MDIKKMTFSEIKAKEKEEKLKHNQMIETAKKICEIKVDINKAEIAFVEEQKECDVLTADCIDLRTKIELERDTMKMLEESIKDLENVLEESKEILEEKSDNVHHDIMEFIEISETFLNENHQEVITDLNIEEIRDENFKKIKLDGEISAIQLFLNTQRRLLNSLKD